MSSATLHVDRIKQINRLIEEMSRFGPTRNAELELNAAHVAAVRSLSYSMSEEALRAVIYDAMYTRTGEIRSTPVGFRA